MDNVLAMSEENYSKREHIHVQSDRLKFQSVVWAPEKPLKGSDEKSDGKARFAVEIMVYIPGAGWDIVNPLTLKNEVMMAFMNYVAMKEMFGYKHVGKSSKELMEMYKNLWGVDKL